MHSRLAEGVDQQNFENDAIPALYNSASMSELPAVHKNAVKVSKTINTQKARAQESGEYAQLSSMSTTKGFGSSILEPSLTTGDALDKYQLVLEKVMSFSSPRVYSIFSRWLKWITFLCL